MISEIYLLSIGKLTKEIIVASGIRVRYKIIGKYLVAVVSTSCLNIMNHEMKLINFFPHILIQIR